MSYIPTQDPFDYGNGGADSYGSRLLGYIGWEPNATNYDSGHFVRSDLVGEGFGYALGEQSIVTNEAIPVGFMRRQAFQANVSVIGRFKFQAITGVATTDHGFEFGVFARMTGGTLSSDPTGLAADFIHYTGGDAYGALVTHTGTNEYAIRIVRWIAGVETQLQGTTYILKLPTLASKALHLRLDAYTDRNGDVELTIQVKNFASTVVQSSSPRGQNYSAPLGGPTVLDVSGTWLTLMTHTDSSGSKIVSGGRCGFIMERERYYRFQSVDDTGIITTLSQFDVNAYSGTPLYSDDMTRTAHSACVAFTDSFGNPCTSLASDYTNDRYSKEQDGAHMLRRDTTTPAERVYSRRTQTLGQALAFTSADLQRVSFKTTKLGPFELDRSLHEMSWSIWANFTANVDGNILYDSFQDNLFGQAVSRGMTFGLKTGSAGFFRMYAKLSSSTSNGATYESGDIAEGGMIGTDAHYAFTLSVPNLRVRFYINGVLQSEKSFVEDPSGNYVGAFSIAGPLTNPTADPTLHSDCTLDEPRLYWVELTANDLLHLADTSGVGPTIDPELLVHGWSFDDLTDDPGYDGFPGTYMVDTFGPSAIGQTPELFGLQGLTPPVSTTGLTNRYKAPRQWSYFAAQRVVDSLQAQNRLVTVEFTNINQTAGIFVRGGFVDPPDSFTGYRLDVRPDPGGYVRLIRVIVGVETIIAEASLSISLATPYVIQLQVGKPDTTIPNTPVDLAAFVDGTQVVLVERTANGAATDSAGNVRDLASDRITSGAQEGFHRSAPTGDAHTYFDDFDQGALLGIELQVDVPTLALPTEVSGVTGDLTSTMGSEPLLPGRRKASRFLASVAFESGHQVRSILGLTERREFKLNYQVTASELAAFRSFWDDHRGIEIPFSFTPENEDVGVFAFGSDSFSTRPITPDLWLLQFAIIERIDPSPDVAALSPPSAIAGLTFWMSAQSNTFDATVSSAPPVSDISTKTPAAPNSSVQRIYAASVGLPANSTAFVPGRHMNGGNSSGIASKQWAVVKFTNTATINDKRTLEPRKEDELFFASAPSGDQEIDHEGASLWSASTGFTFMAHIIPPDTDQMFPPVGSYDDDNHILLVEDSGGNAMFRLGWTESGTRFYATAGVNIAAGLTSAYNLGSTVTAKTILCRWTPNGEVKIWDSGGSAAASTSGFTSMVAGPAASTRFFVSSTVEPDSIAIDASVGIKVFVQDIAFWPRALSDGEIDSVGNYWSAQYGSTWTAIS